MKLNIFFSNKIDRIEFLDKQLNIKYIHNNDNQALSYNIDGLNSFKFKDKFEKIPGYWIEFKFYENKEGEKLYNRLINIIPVNNQNTNVFYPKDHKLSSKQLHIHWINKYKFSINDFYDDKWKLFFKEIKSHIKYKRIDTAFSGLNLILKYNPFFLKKYKRAYLFEELAYFYEEQGNLTKSIQCLKLQSMINPQSIDPYLNMSSFYIMNGLDEDAMKVCKKGLKKNPRDQYLIGNLIIALCSMGNYNFALVFLKDAIKKDKNNKLLWKLLGDVYYETENNEDAIISYKKSLKIESKDNENASNFYTDIYSGIGACYFEKEEYMKAVKYYKKVLTYHNDSYTLLSLSQIYFYYLKDMDMAFKYTKLLLDETPDSGFGQYQLGLIYLSKNNIEKAKWHLYKARKLMPDYIPVQNAIEIMKNNSNQVK